MITSKFSSVVAAVFEYGNEYRVILDDAIYGKYATKDEAVEALVLALDNYD